MTSRKTSGRPPEDLVPLVLHFGKIPIFFFPFFRLHLSFARKKKEIKKIEEIKEIEEIGLGLRPRTKSQD